MEKNANVKNALSEYVKDQGKWFYWYHNLERLKTLHNEGAEKDPWEFKGSKDNKEVEENLPGFFDAVLDEVRIKKANAFASYALYISDNQDLAYFREAVAKREASADIDANKQRDHAVHTLYNYILGWYIFDHSEKLQLAFRERFEKMNIKLNSSQKESEFYNSKIFCKKDAAEFEKSIGLINKFGDVWPIASLLHDIGYILEGNLSSASSEVENVRVTNGSKIIHDYFNHWFWKDYGVDFRAAKNIAKTLGVVVPDFRYSRSLASLGDHLRDIGSCENIRKELRNDKFEQYYPYDLTYGLNREAFSIWKGHYEFYDNTNMVDILRGVEEVYKDTMWTGSNVNVHAPTQAKAMEPNFADAEQ